MGTQNDAGATAIEYSLVIGGICVAIAVAVTLMGTHLGSVFDDLIGWLNGLP